jgi:hypothetical protein
MTVQPYEPPAPLPASRPGDVDQPGPAGWVARLRAAAEIAGYIGGTEFVPDALRNRPEAITAAILYGEEVGLDPMQALAKVAVIKGRPAMLAEAQRSLILRAGHELWFEESTVTRAIAAGRRRGSDRIGRITWTLDDAKRAGLAGQPNYQRYPAEMLRARASAALARTMFADVIGGIGAVEELEGEPDNGPAPGPPAAPPPADAPPTPARRQTRRRAAPASPAPPPASEEKPLDASPAETDAQETREPLEPPTPPDTQPEPEIAPVAATDAQKRQIFALMRDVGIADRQERLDLTGEAIGRTIESLTELTIGEASLLIDALAARRAEQGAESASTDARAADADEAPTPLEYGEFPPGY